MCWKYLEQYMVFFVDLFLELRLRFVVSAVLVCISEFLFVFVFVVLFAFVFIYACVLRVCVCDTVWGDTVSMDALSYSAFQLPLLLPFSLSLSLVFQNILMVE